MKLILASKSPRRKELMELMGLDFTVQTADTDESVGTELTPAEIVCYLSQKKAAAVFNDNKDACVIGSDTIVVYEGHILGKPKSKDEAKEMLRLLSGNTHIVYTGIAVITQGEQLIDYDATEVEFSELTDDEIEAYVESGEPMDKAGAYGVQGEFCKYIKHINGSFFSVMGLPVNKLYYMLKRVLCNI